MRLARNRHFRAHAPAPRGPGAVGRGTVSAWSCPEQTWSRRASATSPAETPTVEALLVSIGARRLIAAGLELPAALPDPELRLYELLAEEDQDSAHGRYNALVRRLVSYERAAECAS